MVRDLYYFLLIKINLCLGICMLPKFNDDAYAHGWPSEGVWLVIQPTTVLWIYWTNIAMQQLKDIQF